MRSPLIKTKSSKIHKGKYIIKVYDQPGKWALANTLHVLRDHLTEIAEASMDEVPTYGVFSGDNRSFSNRLIGVVYVAKTMEPAAFTALVYLPIKINGKEEIVLHTGLTMVKKRFRGERLQSKLFEKTIFLPFLNQFRTNFIITSIAASPAGVGSIADHFEDPYPHYNGNSQRKPYHLEVAKQVLDNYRYELGCSDLAEFDEDTFVVKGSNQPEGGGAYQFIKDDPVSKYRNEACNNFCKETLNYPRGDELFQVANLDLIKGLLKVFKRRKL